jgi:hypothetical protein
MYGNIDKKQKQSITAIYKKFILRLLSMKTKLLIIFLFEMSWLKAQIIELPKQWKFQVGDNIQWTKPEFDDSRWKSINTVKFWEEQGFPNVDGIAWYRSRFVLKDSMKLKKYLIFFLGKIDDEDHVFLNGKLIGQNNQYVPIDNSGLFYLFQGSSGLSWTKRYYILRANDPRINWGKENVLAVRVNDISGNGGMTYNAPLTVRSSNDSTTIDLYVPQFSPFTWPDQTPASCPFDHSKQLKGIAFLGYHTDFYFADTWYPTWASDDKLYSPYTDGTCVRLDGGREESGSWDGDHATTGQAVIEGSDPLNLKVYSLGLQRASAKPYNGRYPCGSLVYNGVWYYGTYCLGPEGSSQYGNLSYNWPWIGPFVGFRYSVDYGRSWTACPLTPEKPLFGENGLNGYPVKIGSPHFVDFGKNMEYSPDGKAYLVAHGADTTDNMYQFYNDSWITGDQIYLIRVTPSIKNMNDVSQYEYFAGYDAKGAAIWTKNFKEIKPMLEWNNNMGCVTMTYNPILKKYLMCVTDGENTVSYMHTYILESDNVSGPWKMITYMKNFGEQSYFVNIPSKFIKKDGYTMWLCYSANFATNWNGMNIQEDPQGSHYGLVLQKIELLSPSTLNNYPKKK